MKSIIIDAIPNLLSFIVGIIFYKLQPKWLQLIVFFLLFILIAENGSIVYSHYTKESNHFIANIYFPIEFCFYFFLFYKSSETRKVKLIISVSFLLYVLAFLCDMMFIHGFYYINIYSYCLGSVLIILCCLLYFMTLFGSDRVLNYFRLPMFWIATGLLFFYVGNLVQYSLLSYIINNNIDPDGSIHHFIITIFNVLLHGSFTISFLCSSVWKKPR